MWQCAKGHTNDDRDLECSTCGEGRPEQLGVPPQARSPVQPLPPVDDQLSGVAPDAAVPVTGEGTNRLKIYLAVALGFPRLVAGPLLNGRVDAVGQPQSEPPDFNLRWLAFLLLAGVFGGLAGLFGNIETGLTHDITGIFVFLTVCLVLAAFPRLWLGCLLACFGGFGRFFAGLILGRSMRDRQIPVTTFRIRDLPTGKCTDVFAKGWIRPMVPQLGDDIEIDGYMILGSNEGIRMTGGRNLITGQRFEVRLR